VGTVVMASRKGEKWYITRLSSAGGSALIRVCRLPFAALIGLMALVLGGWSAPAASAADPNKVLRIAFPTAETGFDPVLISDLYSATVNEAIFERLLTYDYLARPAKLVPMAAETMPEITDNGRTYTFRIRKGIYFSADPAFTGRPRELTAQDFVYSYMRFMDPKNRSPYAFLLQGALVGLDELAAKAEKAGKFDYDAKIPGLEAVDRYTLRFRLKTTDYNFPYIAAHTSLGAVAREVIDAYGDDTMAHPVGTGPYALKSWTRRARIVLEANPNYRGFVWDFQPSADAWDQGVIAAMRGKQMPQVGRVEINVIEEEQARWLAFNGKELDYFALPPTFREKALDGDKLNPELTQEGIALFRAIDPEMTYTFFNTRDPVLGGFGREKIALRRAVAMGYDLEQEIRVVRKGQAIELQMPIPPGVVGHDPNYRSIIRYDPDTANKLLDYFGYKKGKDSYRTLPDGKPLVLRLATETGSIGREFNELWKKSMDRIGINMQFDVSKFDENRKAAKACQLQMWGQGWIADYPDGDNFMQNYYGPNIGQSNNGCYASKAFDKFYEQARALPDSPERNRLFLLMTRQLEVDTAQSLQVARVRNELLRPWVKGYKKHPILQAEWQYVDVEPRRR
jgi:ABC-type transport system substrate-binding protein